MVSRAPERDFVSRTNPAPIKLPEFRVVSDADTPALPDPVRFRWCMVAVLDRNCVAVSNGVSWLRADGTAL